MKKLYISGQITGIENEAPLLFESAEKKLKALGFDTINPITINHDHHDKSWVNYMREDIKAMCDCDSIFMLNNWMNSKGAIIEHTIANFIELELMYETHFDKWYKNHYTKLNNWYKKNNVEQLHQQNLNEFKTCLLLLKEDIKMVCDANLITVPHNYQQYKHHSARHYVALCLDVDIVYTEPQF